MVHGDSLDADYVAQEGDLSHMELPFFDLDKEVVAQQFGQDRLDMGLVIIYIWRVDGNII